MTIDSPRAVRGSVGLPKSARLRKSRDFRFRPFRRFRTQNFTFIFTSEGKGRVGISLSRKVLRRAVARNRVRRLVKEAFRLHRGEWMSYDIHVIGQPPLASQWESLRRQDLERELEGVVGWDREKAS